MFHRASQCSALPQRARAAVRTLCSDSGKTLEQELGLRRSAMTTNLLERQRQRQPQSSLPEKIDNGPVVRMSTAPLLRAGSRTPDTLQALYMREARAVYEETDGCLGALLLFDASRTTARSLTLWRDPEAMERVSEHPDYARTMTELGAHFAKAPEIETWRVGAAFFTAGDVGSDGSGASRLLSLVGDDDVQRGVS